MEDKEKSRDTLDFRPNNYDLIRLLAALQVVYFHGVEHFNLVWLKDASWSRVLSYFPGVPIFFFMSGIMVCASFRRSRAQVQYFVNRFLRIFPGLWACLVVSIVSVLVFSNQAVFTYENFGRAVIWLIVFSLAAFTLAFAYTKPNLSNWLLRGVDISYGTYIYHMVIVNALLERGASQSAQSLLIVFLITIALAWVSWHAVERPALALKYFFTTDKATVSERENKVISNHCAGSTVSRPRIKA